MATKKQVVDRAEELGCTFTYDGTVAHLEAPQGMILAGPELHYADIWNHPRGAWKASDIYDEMLDEMKDGVVPCETPDCDACHG